MTKEELEAQEERSNLIYEAVAKGMKAVKDDARGRGFFSKGTDRGTKYVGGCGQVKCPVCDDGTIGYRVAGVNGHTHAGCTTSSCVRWME